MEGEHAKKTVFTVLLIKHDSSVSLSLLSCQPTEHRSIRSDGFNINFFNNFFFSF